VATDDSIPTIIDGMPVVLFSRIDQRHAATNNCTHIRFGDVLGPAWGLAICDAGKDGFYLLRCEDDWVPVTDTWHDSIANAKGQAAFEYEGVEATWQEPPN
jgi:hypothetical protein